MNLAQSLTGRRWVLRPGDDRLALGIAQRLGLPEMVGRLLAMRGVDLDIAEHFLAPTLRALMPDPRRWPVWTRQPIVSPTPSERARP